MVVGSGRRAMSGALGVAPVANVTTQMVAQRSKIDSALTTPYPAAFDVKNDVFVPGRADKFRQQLKTALDTRNLLSDILEVEPTLLDIVAANPNASSQECADAFDAVLARRAFNHKAAAGAMSSVVKSLTFSEQGRFDALAANHQAVEMYEYIMSVSDLRSPKVQDRLRAKYAAIAITPSATMQQVIDMVELKYYLFKQHGLYDTTRPKDNKEGITEMGPVRLGAARVGLAAECNHNL